MLERARSEVAALASRRQDITTQLGHLSGVIDALSVPDRAAAQGSPTPDDASTDPPASDPLTATSTDSSSDTSADSLTTDFATSTDPDPSPHQERTDHE